MSDPVDPHLFLACCRNYGFLALDEYDIHNDTYRLTWIDEDLLECCATGSLASVVQAMAASLHIARLPLDSSLQEVRYGRVVR